MPDEEPFDELELLELPGAVKLVEGSERFELLVLPELEVPELELFEAVPLGPEVLLEEELPDEVPVPCEALGSKKLSLMPERLDGGFWHAPLLEKVYFTESIVRVVFEAILPFSSR